MRHTFAAVREQGSELVASPAAEDIAVSELTLPGRSRCYEEPVAGLVAVAVVERFEVVEIQQR